MALAYHGYLVASHDPPRDTVVDHHAASIDTEGGRGA
jgi:hypothetical protein